MKGIHLDAFFHFKCSRQPLKFYQVLNTIGRHPLLRLIFLT